MPAHSQRAAETQLTGRRKRMLDIRRAITSHEVGTVAVVDREHTETIADVDL